MILAYTSQNIQILKAELNSGGLVGIPTETVYGLAANAFDENAIKKIYKLKGRPSNNPLIVHIANYNDIFLLTGDLNQTQKQWLEDLKGFWPGPLTVVLPKNEKISESITAGLNSVAIRVPNHPATLDLIKVCDFPLVAPSANKSKKVSPTKAEHVEEECGTDLKYILDGGDCKIGIESTVVSLVEERPRLLRPGGISIDDLERALGEIEYNETYTDTKDALTSPGQQIEHYCPQTPIAFYNQDLDISDKKVGFIAFSQTENQAQFSECKILSESNDMNEIAQKLFASIRELDKLDLDLILVDSCGRNGLGLAIMDRLNRSTAKFRKNL